MFRFFYYRTYKVGTLLVVGTVAWYCTNRIQPIVHFSYGLIFKKDILYLTHVNVFFVDPFKKYDMITLITKRTVQYCT